MLSDATDAHQQRMTSAADSSLVRRFAALVARAAADPGAAAELRAELRTYGKKKRAADLVLAPAADGALLLLGGEAVDVADDENTATACAFVAKRLALYGVEEITITTRAADADLYDLVRLLAAVPAGDDPAAHFASRAAGVDARSIPRRLRPRASAPVEAVAEAPAIAPAAAPARSPTPRSTPTVGAETVLAEPAAPPVPAESADEQRSDRLTESLDIPPTASAALAALFARLQACETPDALTAPLDELAAWTDLAFRTGRHDDLIDAMAGLLAIEHEQLERDPSDDRRRAFAQIIRQLAKPLMLRQLAVLRHRRATDPTAVRRTQAILYRYGTDGADALIDEYVTVATPEARAACLEGLRALRRTHDALFALVRDTRDLVVRQAAGLLGELGDPRGEQMLIELLRHPDARARRAAVAALACFATTTALEGTGLALGDESPVVRARAVAALAERGGVRAVALLTPLLDAESDKEVLFAAIAALGTIGGPEAVTVLIHCAQGESTLLRKRSAAQRIAACTALVTIRTPQAMACVQVLRTDRDREVRDAAVRLVAQAARRTVGMRAVTA